MYSLLPKLVCGGAKKLWGSTLLNFNGKQGALINTNANTNILY